MKLIKINTEYYLLSDDTKDTGGKNIMWLGDVVEHFPKQGTAIMNKYSIFPNSIYSGKPADDYKLVVSSTNKSFETENKLDVNQIEKLICDCEVGHPYNNLCCPVHGESEKKEWDVECDMQFASRWEYYELPKTEVKVNKEGFVNIKSIKK
jgi:hypothetical protein